MYAPDNCSPEGSGSPEIDQWYNQNDLECTSCINLPTNGSYTGSGTSATDCPWTCPVETSFAPKTCSVCQNGHYNSSSYIFNGSNNSGDISCTTCPNIVGTTGTPGSDTVRDSETKCYKVCTNSTDCPNAASNPSGYYTGSKCYWNTTANVYKDTAPGGSTSCTLVCVGVPAGVTANSDCTWSLNCGTGTYWNHTSKTCDTCPRLDDGCASSAISTLALPKNHISIIYYLGGVLKSMLLSQTHPMLI